MHTTFKKESHTFQSKDKVEKKLIFQILEKLDHLTYLNDGIKIKII